MNKIISSKPLWAFIFYVVLDIFCIGAGMGVPFFCILFGFPIGWIIARRIATSTTSLRGILQKILLQAVMTSAVTMLGMILIWGASIAMLFNPSADLVNFGTPMILYEPRASFIGWIVLMILISPFLQFLMTLFGSHIAMISWLKRHTRIND